MNRSHHGGAIVPTLSFPCRRLIPLLVMVCSLYITGVLFLPSASFAAGKTIVTAAASKPSPAKTQKKNKPVAKKRPAKLNVRSILPTGEQAALKERGISSGFGPRFISKKNTRLHKGIDIPGPKNSKVLAFNDGEVIFTGSKSGYGKVVVVRQIDGREALYAHMNSYVVAIGQQVRRGDHVGHVGRTGRATGYHLHFELIDDGKNLDPAHHVWHGSELVLGPQDLDFESPDQTRIASPAMPKLPVY